MAKYFIRKLERYVRLSADEKSALLEASSASVRRVGAREDIIREGDRPRHVNLILDGFACRYKVLEDGRRQIVGFFAPGDLCDQRVFVLKSMDHSISSISPVSLAELPADTLTGLTDRFPRIARALWWMTLVDESVSREWVMNIGQRSALERMAHLICELFLRLKCVGLTDENSCELPMTQTELADALGLSAVHTNRTLQELRTAGLIVWKGRKLTIPDFDLLAGAALFSAHYLHLDQEGHELDAKQR